MKAAVYCGPAKHQNIHAHAMKAGLERHGIAVEFFDDMPPIADFVVMWGWRRGKLYRSRGEEVLVMERGYLGDRFAWTSLGWNGLNGNAVWNAAYDNGERFAVNFGHLYKPWKNRDGYALIMGQVRGDASLGGLDHDQWSIDTFDKLTEMGYDVRYRQHPVAAGRGHKPPLPSMEGSLDDAFKGAAVAVTYNSNGGVDAGLSGIPVVATDSGSMAWPIAAHDIDGYFIRPDRDEWLRDLAWRQWTIEEIETGVAWDHIKRNDIKSVPRNVLVLGGGKSVWEDAEKAFALGRIDAVIAINDCIRDYPGNIDIALTLHPMKLDMWLKARLERGYPMPRHVISHYKAKHVSTAVNYQWPDWTGKMSGSSGLFAVKVAYEILDAKRVILAGVPMVKDEAHYHNPRPWNDVNTFIPAWNISMDRLTGRVKSFGGWTAEKLGIPTKEWLNEH